MVHQLSLFGSIDDASYDLLISTMSILSGTPPVVFARITNMWKPNEIYEFERVNSKNQLTELNRIKLTRDIPLRFLKDVQDQSSISYTLLKKIARLETPLELSSFETFLENINYEGEEHSVDDVKMEVDSFDSTEFDSEAWSLSMSDIPAAGNNRKVCMQTISQSIILSAGGKNSSTSKFLKGLGYVPDFRYVTIGVKFYMIGELVLEIQKVWDLNDKKSLQITKGGYLIKAYINVTKATDIERINQAEIGLLSLQKDLQGYIDLSVPDRRSMDSRLNNMNDIL